MLTIQIAQMTLDKKLQKCKLNKKGILFHSISSCIRNKELMAIAFHKINTLVPLRVSQKSEVRSQKSEVLFSQGFKLLKWQPNLRRRVLVSRM